MYDLNQRTVAALDRLAEVYETSEDTWDIVEKESAEGDMLCASEETSWRRHGSTRTAPWKCQKIVARAWIAPSGNSETDALFMRQRGSI